ncbi:MAG: FAD-dependent oxidoreductase [Rhizobacter sp.]|nr:FAD-dependent oxidoreductase [Chlorobiales bacterium]
MLETIDSNVRSRTGGKSVLILGGGLAGLAAAKKLVDNGFQVEVLEKRNLFGGKVSSWKDSDGDSVETGLHCFFGAYVDLYDLMRELGTYERILWKKHELTYTLSKGERFTFRTWKLPSPLHLTPALFGNGYFKLREMLTFAKALVPILFGGDKYYAAQDDKTYEQWHEGIGISKRMLKKMFLPMALALKFLPPEELSAKVVLDVTGNFLRLPHASEMGFLKGSPDEHLTGPLVSYLKRNGATLRSETKVKTLLYDGDEITGVELESGEVLHADYYLTALPVHNLQRLVPEPLKEKFTFFRNLDAFEGVPVITVQLWYDKQISHTDNVLFSPDGVIPVYADMAHTTPEYATLRGLSHAGKSRFQFCVAPAKNLMPLSDEEVLARVDASVRDCFPETSRGAKVVKSTIVRIPQSVYAPTPDKDKLRPTQATPVANLFLAGGYTQQRFYDSMEGAVASGRLAAKEVLMRCGIPV